MRGPRAAAGQLRLGGDGHPVDPRGRGQWFGAWETGLSQCSLDLHTADDPRLEATRLHHDTQTAGQLDPDDLGEEPGAEEHAVRGLTQVLPAPPVEECVVEHARTVAPSTPQVLAAQRSLTLARCRT